MIKLYRHAQTFTTESWQGCSNLPRERREGEASRTVTATWPVPSRLREKVLERDRMLGGVGRLTVRDIGCLFELGPFFPTLTLDKFSHLVLSNRGNTLIAVIPGLPGRWGGYDMTFN